MHLLNNNMHLPKSLEMLSDGTCIECREKNVHGGKLFFRKHFAINVNKNGIKTITNDSFIEKMIVSIIEAEQKDDRLIKIYGIADEYYDAELLNIHHNDKFNKLIYEIAGNLESLHELNIIYVDLKQDNMGYSSIDNRWKLIDFDCSGICNSKKTEWQSGAEAPFHVTAEATNRVGQYKCLLCSNLKYI